MTMLMKPQPLLSTMIDTFQKDSGIKALLRTIMVACQKNTSLSFTTTSAILMVNAAFYMQLKALRQYGLIIYN